jgi:hypothetical protein
VTAQTAGKVLAVYVAMIVASLAGWINNIIWTFHQSTVVDVALGILGVVMFPVGVVHGIYLWFV